MIYAYRYRIIAYSVLCALFLGAFTKVLPTENIDLVFFAAFCIAGFAAVKKGQPHVGVISLIAIAVFIQIGINLLGLTPLAKIANAVMFFIVAFRHTGLFPVVKKEAREVRQARSNPKKPSTGPKTSVQSVFEDFQKFTGTTDGTAKEPQDKEGPRPKRRRRSSQKHNSDKNGQSSHRRRRKPRPKSDEPTKPKNHQPRTRSRSSAGKEDLKKAQEALQAEQHAVQQEKRRLQEQAEKAERERRATETKLRREAESLKNERDKLRSAQLNQTNDHRSPEEVLGLPSNGYTLQELKDARKREVMRWNPSNMVNKPPELVKQSEEELKKINLAFDRLKKKIG